MTDPMLKIQILARAEAALLRLQAKKSVNKIVLLLVALVFALLALVMLNFAAYHALNQTYSTAVSALIVASVNVFFAICLSFLANKVNKNDDQEKMITEIRNLAYKELSADVDEVKCELMQVSDDVKRIRTGFNALTSSSGLSSGLSPLLGLLINAFKKAKK
jgi:cell shape-determining protein MreC